MVNWGKVLAWMPEVVKPKVKRLGFNEKLKWTGITLLIYFVLSHITLFGLGQNKLQELEYLSIIFGTVLLYLSESVQL